MNKIYKTAIIGGGVSGLFCATELLSENSPFSGDDILLLERNDRVGKKILVTGNGQGNISNKKISIENYNGDKNFISEYLSDFATLDFLNYLNKFGIYTCEGEDGKLYPISFQANVISDALRIYLSYKGCNVICKSKVTDIKKNKFFELSTVNGEKFFAENVVLAAGGKASKQFGTDGNAYNLAKSLGHKVTALYPSLVQLKTEKEKIKGLKGIKEFAKITIYDGKKQIKSAVGDVLFTDYGISGNAVFKISDKVGGLQNPNVLIEFLPNIDYKTLKNILYSKNKLAFFSAEDLLNGIVHKNLGRVILNEYGKNINDIVDGLKNFKLKVTGTLGFDYAQVTKGGIVTSEVNPKSFESLKTNGFYIVGEVLDIDGECGGYNMTFAITSGVFAAKDIIKKYL